MTQTFTNSAEYYFSNIRIIENSTIAIFNTLVCFLLRFQIFFAVGHLGLQHMVLGTNTVSALLTLSCHL